MAPENIHATTTSSVCFFAKASYQTEVVRIHIQITKESHKHTYAHSESWGVIFFTCTHKCQRCSCGSTGLSYSRTWSTHTYKHTHGHNLANHFPTRPTKKSSPRIKTSLKPQFYVPSPTETKQPFSQCAHVHKYPSVESCDVAGGYFQPTSTLGKTAPRSNGLVKPEQVYSMETGSQTWGTEENLFDLRGKEEGEGNQCLWRAVNGTYERSGQLFHRHREMGKSDPAECARAIGALSLSLFSSVAIPVPFLFPCPYAVYVMQMSLGSWAVGLSARQRAEQEQEQLPDRREEPELFVLGSSPHREVWGRRSSRQPLVEQLPRKLPGQGLLAGLPEPWDLGKGMCRAELFLSWITDWHGGATYAGGTSGCTS